MKTFIDDDFLLSGETARELYHEHAKEMPIHDFHSHLPAGEIAEDSRYDSLSEVWLGSDHYKWRAMRTDGVDERFITGDASDWEKFRHWAGTVSRSVGNPLYHWTHLELLRYFHIDDLLDPESAEKIYGRANEMLRSQDFSVRRLLERMNVKVVCTTDDPTDSLEHHRRIQEEDGIGTEVVPTFRPDKAFVTKDPDRFNSYINALGERAQIEIDSFSSFVEALEKRHEYFHSRGGRSSDHGLLEPVAADYTLSEVERIFAKLRSGKGVTSEESDKFIAAGLVAIGRMNAKRGWVMQLHIGPQRNNNTAMYEKIGPDTGFDSIADGRVSRPLSKFLDALAYTNELPKMIIYNLNPRDNMLIGSLIGSFQDGSFPGKVQLGSGWWFNDQRDGMERQLKTLANTSLLYHFVGMLTDSRSFLSFPRHEYFRRILCNLVGSWVEGGEAPRDMKLLGDMIRNISFSNAERFFGKGESTDTDRRRTGGAP